MTHKTKSARVEFGPNSATYTEHVDIIDIAQQTRHSCRIRIHTDGYASQSYGSLERWDSKRWRAVVWMRGSALKIPLNSSYDLMFQAAVKVDDLRAYAADRTRLLSLAEEVLS